MIFLYKLALRHPSFIGKKITAQLESVLEIKMKNLFQDSANREENQKFYTQYLFFSEHFREANPFQRYKILLVVLKCRGLLRTLLYLIPLPDHEVPLDLHASKRMYILKTLFRKRAIFFNEIIARLKVLYPTPNDLKLAPLVTNIMQFNLIELAVHQGKKMIYFDTQNGEPPIFGCANPTKIPKMEAFFHKLMSWDSRSVAAFVVKKQMQDISKRYFDEVYPHIHFGSDDFQSMQIRVLPRFDEVLGFDSTVQFQSRHQIFESVQIWHQRFIISKKELLVHDSTSHPKQKFVAGQWHFVKSFEEGENRCLIRRVLGETKHLDSGIFLSGRCDENWYHFILDTVPRILFVNDVPKDVPLLIRSDIPEHSKAVLATITDREIIEIKPNEILEVQNLYVVPGRSSVFDSTPPKGTPFVEFSPSTLEMIRSLFLKLQTDLSKKHRIDSSFNKISLSRSSTTRNIQNASSIDSLLEKFGFLLCELNLPFFKEQIATFSQARIVVAPGGAALANIIFMPAGSVVVVLRSRRNSDLNLWVKLAKAVGVNCIEVTGMPTYFGPGKLRRMHSDFYISSRKLRKVLASVTA